MARTDRVTVDFAAGPLAADDVVVTRVTGREALSRPFAFEVEFRRADREAIPLADLVGTAGHLTLVRPGLGERHVDGLVRDVGLAGVEGGHPHYRARLVPRLAELAMRRGRRIFQDLSALDIVKQVLDEGEVAHREQVNAAPPVRPYCAQCDESDLELVTRLLAEEGLSYIFEHAAGGHEVVIVDGAQGCPAIEGDPVVPFRVSDRSGGEVEHLNRLERVRQVAEGIATLADFDFTRPALKVSATARAGGAPPLESYSYPAGFTDGGVGGRRAEATLQGLRLGSDTFAGSGSCTRLTAGSTFEVRGHLDPSLEAKLLVLEAEHEVHQQEGGGEAGAIEHAYQGSFLAVEASTPLRPPALVRRPRALTETATVVGPAGEEIHVDEHGRIRVQFHWDRDGKHDERSTCWLRCTQPWAGPGWGASFVPRIGQEVVVRFLEGDPDRPFVVGALYNGRNPPPLLLPQDKTRSTLRSDSSLGSNGFNELRFEDQAGREEFFLHAQKDEQIEVLNDKAQRVHGNERLDVAKDRSKQVVGQHELRVTAEDGLGIGGNETLTVAGQREIAVAVDHRETVAGLQSISVGGNRHVEVALASAETIGAAAALTIGAAYAVTVGAVHNTAVGGALLRQVGGAAIELVGLGRQERVGADSTFQVGGDLAQEVDGHVGISTSGDHQETVDEDVEVEAKKEATSTAKVFDIQADTLKIVVGGQELLSIDKSGNVTFGAKSLAVDGTTITLKGSKVQLDGQDAASSSTPAVTQIPPKPGEKAFVEIELKDQDGNPVPNAWFRVEFPDGTVKEGRTGGAGKAWVPGPKEGTVKVSFPGLDGGSWEQG